MKRRNFIKTITGAAASGVLLGVYTWQIEPFWLEFVRIAMPIQHLPDHLVGRTLMQISDMHVGNQFDRQYLIDSLKKAQKFAPDFVLYTGDYVSYETEEQIGQLSEVMQHATKGKMGTYAVFGNHDYGYNWAQPEVANQIGGVLENVGIRVLRNEAVEANELSFIGLDDFWATNYAPEKVLSGFDHDRPCVTLCHNPDVLDEAVWGGYKSWVLSGHTHGGQCKPPFLTPPLLPVRNRRYSSGLISFEDGRKLYINRALGNLIQVRFNVRPEITIFELQKANLATKI